MNAELKTTLKIVDRITQEATNSPADLLDKGLPEFIKELYKFTPAEELSKRDNKSRYLSAMSIFSFINEKPKNDYKIRVFNPAIEKDGWESPYTHIEMINDDMPFLVDSLSEEVNRHNIRIVDLFHPVIRVVRNANGALQSVANSNENKGSLESVVQMQIARISNKQCLSLEKDLRQVLDFVKSSVNDWEDILKRVSYVITEINATSEFLSHGLNDFYKKQVKNNALEIQDFLQWLKGNNFVFLGYVEHKKGDDAKAKIVKGSNLGILKLDDSIVSPRNWSNVEKNPFLSKNQDLLEITKANRKSPVHRPAYMDYIGIKKLDENGEVLGEHSFIGLFTSSVYYQSIKDVPLIRKKLEWIHKKSGFSEGGHSKKALAAILEDFPRDELLQSTEQQLFDTAMGIVLLSTQPKVKLFFRKDEFERFVSCIAFIPREVMSTGLRLKIEEILTTELNGEISNYYTQITEANMARLQFVVKTTPSKLPKYDEAKIEQKVVNAARVWTDDLRDDLCKRAGEEKGEELFEKYKAAFSVSYHNRFSLEDAYYDILRMEKLLKEREVSFDIYESLEGTDEIFEFKIFTLDEQIRLSRVMPILENMGLSTLDEHTYIVKPAKSDGKVWIHRFRFTVSGLKKPRLSQIKANFEESISKTWYGVVTNDSLNRLILLANLQWRDIKMIRAYSKYLQQSGFSYSTEYVQNALCNHSEIVKLLVELFNSRFSPDCKEDREGARKRILSSIDEALSKVSNLAEDRIIRAIVELINATKRTNYYQKDSEGKLKEYMSFKFTSSEISWLPQPKPYAEIFVYSSRVEGVHLRGGKVARGGLRWSDRHEDFRTEVLGLMKAQMTKNSVIIPVGSKGGFVLKKAPTEGGREALLAEGIECYKTFLRGLLDVTDNIVSGKIKHPKNVVRHDGDDAYLVVAADKGTATFSDIANSVSAEYNFWLGDAFASGGSVGYDHKKMGITAKGGWISVQRHFQEMGVDVDKDDFTVIGIGDMAGDVFGNGMLRSKHTKLVGAFNHMHIFLDPTPDAEKSFKERERLFNLPRSSWADYDAKLISNGGGIFARSDKSIKLSKQVKELLQVDADSLAPDELIRYMLKAPVGLLWNGGIGTYVKSKRESNENVGDKTNDALRINGEELRAKIVGEGGNLGFTQLGRIEYAQSSGRLNTDAIDNSAGVDCSDHEVNIKIVLSDAVASGSLTLEKRNKLLESMTDNVAELVLRDNRLQTQALTIAQLQGASIIEILGRMMTFLEKNGHLNRAIEYLPDAEEIARRNADGKGLTRPELAVILAYSKIVLYDNLLSSKLPDDDYYMDDLIRYFPEQLQSKFRKEIENNPLRREIIATSVTNSILNRMGSALFYHIQEDTGVAYCDIARAYTVARDVFGLRELWDDVAACKGLKVEQQQELFMEIQNIVERSTLWFIKNYPQPLKVTKAVNDFASGVKDLSNSLTKIMPNVVKQAYETKLNRYKSSGIDEKLVHKIAVLDALSSACDIVQVARQADLSLSVAGTLYFELGATLNLSWIVGALQKIHSHNYWEKISIQSLVDEIYQQQRRLTSEAIKYLGKDNKSSIAIDSWREKNVKQISRYNSFIDDLKTNDDPDISMVIIAIRKLKEISAI
jgi:glutamate dehydrogenase